MSMEEAAAAVGGSAWAESSLYEAVGQWASTASSPAAKLYFDGASQHHAWRAERWDEELGGRLVQAFGGPGPGPADARRSFSEAARLLVKHLGQTEGDIQRVAVHCRVVLSRSACEYRWWAQRLGYASDGPMARAIHFVLDDVSADWAQGNALLAELMEEAGPGGDGPARAAMACADVERLVVGQGLVFGG